MHCLIMLRIRTANVYLKLNFDCDASFTLDLGSTARRLRHNAMDSESQVTRISLSAADEISWETYRLRNSDPLELTSS